MWKLSSAFLTALVVFIIACAPKAAPAPTPPVQAPAGAATLPSVSSTIVLPEDEAWARTVAAAKKEGEVTIYSFLFAGDVGLAVSKAFKDKYGIRADIIAGSSPLFVERIKAEDRAGQHIADLLEMTTARLVYLRDEKLLVTTRDLPVLKDKAVWYTHPFDLDPDGYVLSYYYTISTPHINTTMVKPADEPKSWLELLQPRWKGKIAVGDPSLNIGVTYNYWALVKKTNRLPEDYFKQLGPQIGKFISVGSAREPGLVLARGEAYIVPLGATTAQVAPVIVEGAPLKALSMKEGSTLTTSTSLATLAKAPHPNAARVFLNWFLSDEGLKIVAEKAVVPTLRKDVPDYLPPAARVDMSTVVSLDIKDMDEINKLYNAGFLGKLWKESTAKQ